MIKDLLAQGGDMTAMRRRLGSPRRNEDRDIVPLLERFHAKE